MNQASEACKQEWHGVDAGRGSPENARMQKRKGRAYYLRGFRTRPRLHSYGSHEVSDSIHKVVTERARTGRWPYRVERRGFLSFSRRGER